MVKNLGMFCSALFTILFLFSSCQTTTNHNPGSPAGYDFSKSEKMVLFKGLQEVSGIAFMPGTDSVLMAINDEDGRIYTVDLSNPGLKSEPFKFAGKGDFEDISFYNGRWQVLQSNGIVYSGDLYNPDWTKPGQILPKGEYEGMAASQDTLFVICKDCPQDKEGTATVFLLKMNGDSLKIENTVRLEAGAFLKGKDKKVLPSALAKHPVTQEWYILSHLNGCLFITDEQFNIKQYLKLPRSVFLQPEGIAFSPNGDLFISSEGDKNPGYILKFEYGN